MQQLSEADLFRALPLETQQAELAKLSNEAQASLLRDWSFWARPDQLPPPGDWRTWLILAGRGWGKSRTGAEWVKAKALASPCRIALVGLTAADCRAVMIEGESGIMSCHSRDQMPLYESSKRQVTWPNGSIATTYNASEPDQLRGPQHHCFVAGTMVATPSGPVAVEKLAVGDIVITRRGAKPVKMTGSRLADVGRVIIGNSILIGTGDHPVLTSRGWLGMSKLSLGDTACAIDASIGVATAGTVTTADTSNTVEQGALGGRTGRGFTERFIVPSMGPSRKDRKFTTWTRTSLTTIRTICLRLQRAITAAFICGKSQCRALSTSLVTLFVPTAEYYSSGATIRCLSVSSARASGPIKTSGSSGHAPTAEANSNPPRVFFAASVASTWERAGRMEVFNLQVEGQPEYFANGILVHNCAWVDELAKFPAAQNLWDQLAFGLRLGTKPQALVTTTPRPIPIIKRLANDARTIVTRGKTLDNRANMAGDAVDDLIMRYAGTRLGRQELDGEIVDDVPGGLWTRTMLDAARCVEAPQMARVVVAIDPSGTDGDDDTGDEVGIVVAGRGIDGRGYVLADRSCRLSPDGWARRAVTAFHEFEADRIVAERNFGGAMVKAVIRQADATAPYKEVTASRGKAVRAEPVSALFEQGRVGIVGSLPELEDQLCLMTPGGYMGEGSPDRLDAMVWALTEVMLGHVPVERAVASPTISRTVTAFRGRR